MNHRAAVLVTAVVIGTVASMATGQPFAAVAFGSGDGDWFTTGNLDDYGDDLDERLAPGERVFSGHPAYVAESDDARLVFDRPRVHYFAVTFRGTEMGDRQYRRLATALSNGSVPLAIDNTMTTNFLRWDGATPARQAFEAHYCAVSDDATRELYDRTNATLYRHAPSCSADRRPEIDE